MCMILWEMWVIRRESTMLKTKCGRKTRGKKEQQRKEGKKGGYHMRSSLREATMATTDKYKQVGKKKRQTKIIQERMTEQGRTQPIAQRVEIMWQSTRPHLQRRSAPLLGGALPLRLPSNSFMEQKERETLMLVEYCLWVAPPNFVLPMGNKWKIRRKNVVCNKNKGKE